MTYEIEFLPEALDDASRAFDWYEDQSPGLGWEFQRALELAVSITSRWPHASQIIDREIRRVLFRRFPYSLFYFTHKNKIVFIACFHQRQDPNELENRG